MRKHCLICKEMKIKWTTREYLLCVTIGKSIKLWQIYVVENWRVISLS